MGSILLVDDDQMTTEFMMVFLQSENHTVTICNSLQDALSKLGADGFKYSLILTDITLPDGSGFELAELASKLGIPCIAITGHGKSHLSKEQLNLFTDVLIKPIDLDLLIARLNKTLAS